MKVSYRSFKIVTTAQSQIILEAGSLRLAWCPDLRWHWAEVSGKVRKGLMKRQAKMAPRDAAFRYLWRKTEGLTEMTHTRVRFNIRGINRSPKISDLRKSASPIWTSDGPPVFSWIIFGQAKVTCFLNHIGLWTTIQWPVLQRTFLSVHQWQSEKIGHAGNNW